MVQLLLMSFTQLFSLVFVLFLSVSCREDYVSNGTPVFDEVVNLTAELSNDDVVELSLLKNIAIGSDVSDIELSNAEVTFLGSQVPLDSRKMLYDAEKRKYVLENPDYRIVEGQSYSIEITTDSDLSQDHLITATTYIPRAVHVSGYTISNRTSYKTEQSGTMYQLELTISLNEPKDLPAYYQIIPYRKVTELRRNNDGTATELNFSKRHLMKIVEIVESRNGVVILAHKDGVYIDQSRINRNEVKLVLETSLPLTEKEILRYIEVDVHTLSEELYQYHIALDNEVRSLNRSYSYPIERFSNVQNGDGIFGGSSMIKYLIDLDQ